MRILITEDQLEKALVNYIETTMSKYEMNEYTGYIVWVRNDRNFAKYYKSKKDFEIRFEIINEIDNIFGVGTRIIFKAFIAWGKSRKIKINHIFGT